MSPCEPVSSLRQAALGGAGIAHLRRFSIEADLAAGRLVRVLADVPMPTMPVHVVHAFGRQLPAPARLFIDFLVERISKLEVWLLRITKPCRRDA